jgi:hypothetical protein
VVASSGFGQGVAGWPARPDPGDGVFKWLLISIVIVPTLLGVHAATSRRGPRGLPVLLGGLLLYDVLWLFMLYYLNYRWVA